MPSKLQLNVLDQSPIPEGLTAGDALRNSVDLARLADQLGYQRYWVAEHHGSVGLACNSPEVLIGPLAAATSQIRVGSGGVMLPHYSPLKVAENFSMLSSLYPGRIDLGIGRAAGTSPTVAAALQRDRRHAPPDDFPEQLAELLHYFGPSRPAPAPAANPFRLLPATRFTSPEVWLLGSSEQSAIWAAELGLPYCFADFINPHGEAMAAHYRRHFQPSPYLAAPRVAVAVWTICADTDEEALRLSSSLRMLMLMLFRGRLIPVPSVERALAFLEQEGEDLAAIPIGRRVLTGTPGTIHRDLSTLASNYQADEVFVINILHDHAARRRSYELVADAFALHSVAA